MRLPHQRVATIQHRAGYRLALVQRLAHAGPPAGLVRVHERDLRRLPRIGSFFRAGKRPQPLAQRPGVVEHHARPMAEVTPPHAGRPRHVRQQRIGPCPVRRPRAFQGILAGRGPRAIRGILAGCGPRTFLRPHVVRRPRAFRGILAGRGPRAFPGPRTDPLTKP